MSERFTKSAARNVFYGGSVFFFVVFVGLTAQSHWYIVNHSTDAATMTDGVVRGKRVWEKNACIDCHSLLGEGAYFAPELGNVWKRYGGKDDPQGARDGLKAWIQSMPTGSRAAARCRTSTFPTRSSTTSSTSLSGRAASTPRTGRRTTRADGRKP